VPIFVTLIPGCDVHAARVEAPATSFASPSVMLLVAATVTLKKPLFAT